MKTYTRLEITQGNYGTTERIHLAQNAQNPKQHRDIEEAALALPIIHEADNNGPILVELWMHKGTDPSHKLTTIAQYSIQLESAFDGLVKGWTVKDRETFKIISVHGTQKIALAHALKRIFESAEHIHEQEEQEVLDALHEEQWSSAPTADDLQKLIKKEGFKIETTKNGFWLKTPTCSLPICIHKDTETEPGAPIYFCEIG